MRKLAPVALALCLSSYAATALASPVTVQFTVYDLQSHNGFPLGPNDTGSGFVTFEPGDIPASGEGFIGDWINPLPTLALDFTVLGQHYDLSNATLWGIWYQDGVLMPAIDGLVYAEGNECDEIHMTCLVNDPVASSVSDFSLATYPGGTGQFGIVIAGVPGVATGSVSWQLVPIPAPVYLFGSALGLIGMMRRKISS